MERDTKDQIKDEGERDEARRLFACPHCTQVGSCNKFGDITDKNMEHNHPFISSIQGRVCRRLNPVPAMRLDTLSTAQLSRMRATVLHGMGGCP